MRYNQKTNTTAMPSVKRSPYVVRDATVGQDWKDFVAKRFHDGQIQ
jgi:hypothetical protein